MKKTSKTVLFAVALAALTALFSWYFYPKNNSPEAGIQDYTASGFLGEPENSIDVVILGDSIPLCAFSPQIIEENTGISGYTCASTGQTLPKSETFLREFLACQSPKLVILEANHLYKEFTDLDAAVEAVYRGVPLLRYHDNWKFLKPAQALSPVHYTVRIPERGYYEKEGLVPGENTDYMSSYQGFEEIPENAKRTVRSLAALCEKQGTKLLLLSAPSAANWTDACHNAVAALAKDLGVSYVDMNLEEVGIDWTLDTPDAGDHLNGTGAEKASRWLGEYLSKTGLF